MKIIKKEEQGNRKKITLFDFIKISYKTKTNNNSTVKKQKNKPVTIGFSGDFKSWDEAAKLCPGFSAQNILEKTLDSVLKVKNGEAVFERDSFIFDKIIYSFPLLACLFKVGTENNNTLNVLDFGGALGSHYFQNKDFLSPIKIENWTVVEQPHYVNVGNEKVADEILNFKYSIDEVENANVLLLSSVLPYLPNPYEWIDKFIAKQIPYIIIDRTWFSKEHKNRLTIQKVPSKIYEAEYPCWFLNEEELLAKFKDSYDLIFDFKDSVDNVIKDIPSYNKGMFFRKK